MIKRLTVSFLITAIIFGLYIVNFQPIFNQYASNYQVCLFENSSSAKIVNVTKSGFFALKNVKGESCKIKKKDFSLDEFLREFDAELVHVEEIEQGISYYAFSKKVKYKQKVFGKIINLHVFIGKEEITVGAPIIYGSF